MNTDYLLNICTELNTRFQNEGVGYIDIIFRQINEPKVMLRLNSKELSCIFTIYLTENDVNFLETNESNNMFTIEEKFMFLINQEKLRRESIKQNVISSK